MWRILPKHMHVGDSHYQPRLPFDDSTWAEDMLIYEYGKHCLIIGRAVLHDETVSPEQVRIAEKLVKNTEWYWLQQMVYRLHGELNMSEMVDRRKFHERLLSEQGRDFDRLLE